MMKKGFFLLLILLAIVGGCSDPAIDEGGDPSGTGDLTPPEYVEAEVVSSSEIQVSWSAVDGADGYIVYRKDGDGVFEELTEVASAAYADTNFPVDKPVRYSVKSSRGADYFSDISPVSNAAVVNVQNGEATKLQGDGIEMMWSPVEDPDLQKYIVYRFRSRAEEGIRVFEDLTIDGDPVDVYTNSYTDTTAEAGTPYFYRVVWVKNGTGYGEWGPFFFGLKGTGGHTDGYERNDQWNDLEDDESDPWTSDWNQAPVMFSYSDGNGGIEKDVDWYKYRGEPALLTVTITFPDGSLLNTGDYPVKYNFYHNGSYEWPEDQVLPVSGIVTYDDFDYDADSVDLYVKVFVEDSTGQALEDKYLITIE